MLCAKFLTVKHAKVQTGELSQRSLDDYAATCKLVIKAFGKGRAVSAKADAHLGWAGNIYVTCMGRTR